MIIAHKNHETNQIQYLKTHLLNTAKMAQEYGNNVGQENVSYLIGLLHDIGKADKKFQDMIKNNSSKRVNHSSAGSKYIAELYNVLSNRYQSELGIVKEYMQTLIYVIQSHHGLFDIIGYNSKYDIISNIQRRLEYDIEDNTYNYNNEVLAFVAELEESVYLGTGKKIEDFLIKGFEEYKNLLIKLNALKRSEESFFYRHIIVRLYLSILKNADVYDTINAYDNVLVKKSKPTKESDLKKYLNNIENLYKSFESPITELNKARNLISDEVLKRSISDTTGIYRLDLPTGAGKTIVSLRYAINHMINQKKERFFYVAPFLSILEQNANYIRKFIKDDINILEHHSNVISREESDDETKEDSSSTARLDYLMESWDSTLILTTMVQFFQTLFKGKSANLRRFYALSNSVIVLDEVQSLPIEVTYIFNLMINFISKAMNSTVILCTATQPVYDSRYIDHKLIYGGNNFEETDIIKLKYSTLKIFERVKVSLINDGEKITIKDLAHFVISKKYRSILIVLNTKKAVLDLYNSLTESADRKIYYLSTNMCAKHRLDVIGKIKEDLLSGEKITCVSTQLIEAGVDVDFNMVIRSYAGVDSLIQAIGRCNREGKMKEKGEAFLVNLPLNEENITNIPSIKEKKDITEQILYGKSGFIDLLELNDEFYESYYANYSEKMNYTLDNNMNLVDILSLNKFEQQKNEKAGKLGSLIQSFKTAAEKFDLIKEDTKGIIVYYKESEELINELFDIERKFYETYDEKLLKKMKETLKQLQPYTVNLHFNKNLKPMIIELMDGDIKILAKTYYSEKVGVTEEAEISGFSIN